LARAHVPHASLVPNIANAMTLTSRRTFRIAALEGLVVLGLLDIDRVSHPLDSLPVGDQPHVLHVGDGVEEGYETLLVVRRGEPGGVVEQAHRSPVGNVVPLEVLDEHLVDALGVGRSGAGVAHGTAATVEVLPHHHGNLPQPWEGVGRARWDHAVVEELIVEGVGVGWRLVLVHWHRRVVREVLFVQHLEHVVSADRQERCPHAADVIHPDASIRRHDLPLARDLLRPLLLRELFSEAVSYGMRSDFMPFCIQVLNL